MTNEPEQEHIGTVAMGDSGEDATIRKHAEYAASEFFSRVGEGEGEGDVVIDLIVQTVTAALSSRPAQEAVALRKIADMIDDENADLDDAIDIARAALAAGSEGQSHV